MKNLLKTIVCIIVGIYLLFFKYEPAIQIAMGLGGIAVLDRLAAWFDRKVPDSDPRKHT